MAPWDFHARRARRGVAGAGPRGFHGSVRLVQVPRVEANIIRAARGFLPILALVIKRHAERGGAATGATTAAGRSRGLWLRSGARAPPSPLGERLRQGGRRAGGQGGG
eukprot:9690126-Lingulodinium_polyedra.AAC.1